MAEPIIQVRGVSKDFLLPHLRRNTLKSYVVNAFRGRRVLEVQHALRDIDFDIPRGEFFGVVGRNGSGKSTLLKIMAGIYKPTGGHVTVDGRLIPFIELGVGFNHELTGRDNVYLNGAMMGFSKTEVDAIYDDVVAFAELEEYMDQKLKNYSSGMQVRLAFSLATRASGDVLLVDEVLAVGDAAFQRKCFEYFRTLKRSDTTVVFVTHNMEAVREFCDRAIMIEDSRLVAEGSARDVAEQYTRLFTPTAADGEASASSPDNRWGEGLVRYVDVVVPAVLDGDDELCVELEVEASEAVDEVVFGFAVLGSGGNAVLGANSLRKERGCVSLRPGERRRIRWSVPNIFSDGRYTLDVAIGDRSGVTTYDHWKEAATFTVVKDEKTAYPVTPPTSFEVVDEVASDLRPGSRD